MGYSTMFSIDGCKTFMFCRWCDPTKIWVSSASLGPPRLFQETLTPPCLLIWHKRAASRIELVPKVQLHCLNLAGYFGKPQSIESWLMLDPKKASDHVCFHSSDFVTGYLRRYPRWNLTWSYLLCDLSSYQVCLYVGNASQFSNVLNGFGIHILDVECTTGRARLRQPRLINPLHVIHVWYAMPYYILCNI